MKHLRPYSDYINEDFTPYDYSNSIEEGDYPQTPFPQSAIREVVRRGSDSKGLPEPSSYPLFFTENEYTAESYGYYVREAYINITKLFDLHDCGEGRYGEGLARKLMPFVYTPEEIAFIEKSNLLGVSVSRDTICYQLYRQDFEEHFYVQRRKDRSLTRQDIEFEMVTRYFDEVLGADNAEEWAESWAGGQLFMIKNAIGHPTTSILTFTEGANEKLLAYTKANGYDGIKMRDESKDCQEKCISYVVFEPKQISWIRDYKHNAY